MIPHLGGARGTFSRRCRFAHLLCIVHPCRTVLRHDLSQPFGLIEGYPEQRNASGVGTMTERKRRGVARALIARGKKHRRENADLIEPWCQRVFVNPRVEDDKEVHARLDGLVSFRLPGGDDVKFERVCAGLRNLLNELEELALQPSDVLARNLAHARAALALPQEEAAPPAVAVLIHTDRALDSAGDLFGYLENPQTFRALDETLDLAPGATPTSA